MRWQSRDKRNLRKIRTPRLNTDASRESVAAARLFLSRIRFIFLFPPRHRDGNIDESVFEGKPFNFAKLDRDVVNSGDSLYATRKLLPLLSLSHEQKIEQTLCTGYTRGTERRFNDMREICNILRNSWYIFRAIPAGSWFAPAVDTSLFTIAVKLHLRLRGINDRDISLLQASETIRNPRIID